MGGGTFDVSIVQIEGKNYEVLATTGDGHLGGDDFDTELVNYCKTEFKASTGVDIDELNERPKNKALRRLRSECTRAKKVLSVAVHCEINVECIANEEDLSVEVTRATFDSLSAKHLDKIIPIVEQVLQHAELTKQEIDDIVLVGGSTRIVKVQTMLTEFFDNRKLNYRANQDEAVALGAAILANNIKSNDDKLTFQDRSATHEEQACQDTETVR